MFAVGDVVQNEAIGSLRLHPSIMNTNTSLSDYYCVEKDGQTVKLKAPQLTTQVLSKIFRLFPESILLLSEDGYVETPDTDGRFTGIDDLPVWTVSGDSMKPASLSQAGTSFSSSSSSSGINSYSYQPPTASKAASKRGARGKARWTPTYTPSMFSARQRQKPPGVRAQESRAAFDELQVSKQAADWRKKVEICKWSEHESQWKKISNLPIVLTESTATVPQITQMVADDVFGGDQTVLLDCDYLRIPDTPTTKGECEHY